MIKFADNTDTHWMMVEQELEIPSSRITFATYRAGNYDFVVAALNEVAKFTNGVRLILGVGERAEPPDFTFSRKILEQTSAKVRILARSHAKVVLFERPGKGNSTAIVGGRNLGRSEWHDMSYLVRGSDVVPISEHVSHLWRIAGDARRITGKHLSTISNDLHDLKELSKSIRAQKG